MYNKLEWRYIGATSAQYGMINLPSEFSEVFIEAGYANDSGGYFAFTIPRIALKSDPKVFIQSSIWGINSTTSMRVRVRATLAYVMLEQFGINASETYDGIIMRVYCR